MAALIVYASLYPFAGWRVPGRGPLDFLILRWPRWLDRFDLIANLLGYLPLGFLLFVALVRSGRAAAAAAWTALRRRDHAVVHDGAAAELPAASRLRRTSTCCSMRSGTALGVCIGLLLDAHGGIERWQMVRDRWFVARSAGGMALLAALADRPALPDRGAVRARPRARPGAAGRRRDAAGHVGRGLGGGLGRRRRSAGGERDALGGERARDHRPRPARALPGGLHDRRAGLAPHRAGDRRGAARRRRDDALDRAQLRPAARPRLDHGAGDPGRCWSAWPRRRC